MSYVTFKSGDSIQADTLNTMQDEIQKDIQKQIEAAKQELRCPKRYFLDMEVLSQARQQRLQPAVLIHDQGCNPITQVYELQDLEIEYPKDVAAPTHTSSVSARQLHLAIRRPGDSRRSRLMSVTGAITLI